MKSKLNFNGDFFLEKPKNYTKCHFPAPPISNLPFGNKFYNLKHTKIDAIGIKMAKQMKLSDCPTKGHFTSKSGKNIYLFFKPGFLSII